MSVCLSCNRCPLSCFPHFIPCVPARVPSVSLGFSQFSFLYFFYFFIDFLIRTCQLLCFFVFFCHLPFFLCVTSQIRLRLDSPPCRWRSPFILLPPACLLGCLAFRASQLYWPHVTVPFFSSDAEPSESNWHETQLKRKKKTKNVQLIN